MKGCREIRALVRRRSGLMGKLHDMEVEED
jgi:hypothetical protein